MNSSHQSSGTPYNRPNTAKRILFWLSGAGTESLEQCPNWEQRKYAAFGLTVLVPALFAFIACSYAISTLTENINIIIGASLVWSFIILTIDRALLATYRSYQKFHNKVGQFALRFVVAILMGLTISHPLTLLLFKDTIVSVVEEEREAEILEVRVSATESKAVVEEKIAAVEAQIAEQRTNWDSTFSAEFLVENAGVTAIDPTSDLSPEMKAQMEERIATDTAFNREKLAANEKQATELTASYQKLQTELDYWQKEFEREVDGQRSGLVGLGPRAKSIRDDQLAWRRDEAARSGEMLAFLSTQKKSLISDVKATEDMIKNEFIALAAQAAERQKEERKRVAALKQQVQAAQADQFVEQQNTIRGTIAAQIDTRLEEVSRLQDERAVISANEQDRIAAIKAEPRKDLLTQTLALHKLFEAGAEGGKFALTAYLVLAGLFMLVDTIPLVVKFFSKPGPYDTLVDCEEVRYEREREAFLESYGRYMDELADGRLLHLTQNKPLERALIEGVDRSRAAKEFLEHLLELEHSFEEKIEVEREALAKAREAGNTNAAERAERLEHLADAFYKSLHDRMETFFGDDQAREAAARSFS